MADPIPINSKWAELPRQDIQPQVPLDAGLGNVGQPPAQQYDPNPIAHDWVAQGFCIGLVLHVVFLCIWSLLKR